ncbi:hypothetical protein KFL_005830030 [Klebsormidium nitens]|uniref:FHA domain-containing protein n=1 Tax=Klebsormidium nitens TaxID=105231 RepID=A0A1Y1IGJ2_KLENI|nr:hypothetical protein KFL_005830030 [Klebsormidium nitens]|eukprot:GAQ89965.1 hypothetical protein KFL_005830030 [Klebsormidium nitens]
MQKGRASMRTWWYIQHVQKAEKAAEIADSSDAPEAGEFARRIEMEEGRAVMRVWWLDHRLRALDPSRPPLPKVKRTRRALPVRRSPSSTPKQATTVAEAKTVPSGRQEELATASEEHPAPSEAKTITTDTTGAQEPVTPLDDSVSVDAQADRQRKMDVGRANMRNWWTQEQEASKRAVEGTVPEKPSESKTITTDTTGAQEPAAPVDALVSTEVPKEQDAVQVERQKEMDAGRAKMREWWIQEQAASKRKLELQGAESEERPAPSEVKETTTDTTTAPELAAPVDDLVQKEQEAAQAERQEKMDAGRAKMREWWTQQLEATKRALETKTIPTDATGAQELGTPADVPVSIEAQKEQEAAQKMSPEAQAEQQRRMDAGRATMRTWWTEEQEAAKRKLELQAAESEKRPAPSEEKSITTDTTKAQEPAAPVDDPVSAEVQKEQEAAQAERQKKMDAGRAKMREWWIKEQEVTKPAPEPQGTESDKSPAPSESKTVIENTTKAQEPQGTESDKRPAPSESKTVTADTTKTQEPQGTESDKGPAPSESKTVTADTTRAQELKGAESDKGLAPSKSKPVTADTAGAQKLPSPLDTSDKRPAPSESKTVTADTTGAQKLPTPLDILVKIEMRKEREAAERRRAERQRTMDAGRAEMRKWWIKEREATKRALGLAPYGPVWTLVRNDGKEPPISIGKTPLIIGAEVGNAENMVPVKLDYPTVSGVHAKIFAKEVMSYGEYVRAYFVVDLKSTNGVRRNNNFRLRPGTQYKLSDGDTLFFGEEAATIVIKNPQKSP